MTSEHFLRASELFRGVGHEHLRLFLPICRQESVEKGAPIFNEGEPAKFLYIVGQGRAALEMRLERPDGSVAGPTTVASIGPGEAFSWSALVEPHILTLSAKAVEPSELLLIGAEAFREALGRYPDLGYLVMVNVAELLAARLAQTREAFVYERDRKSTRLNSSHLKLSRMPSSA